MDKNKLKVLREIDYKIHSACGFCEHSQFPSASNVWGTCSARKYIHQKHTESERHLSINRYGSCSYFKHDNSKNSLEAFEEFLT